MKSSLTICAGPLLLAALLTGCTEYATPPDTTQTRGADLAPAPHTAGADAAHPHVTVFSDDDAQPLARFPTALAIVRVENSGYPLRGTSRARQFTVVTTRDEELADPKIIEKLGAMPQLRGIAPINAIQVSRGMNSEQDLRAAALDLHADMLLIYMFDSKVYTKDQALPLSILTLGLAPDNATRVETTAAAILIDSHTGYLYGTAEATSRDEGLTTSWTIDAALDNAKDKTERDSFVGLADDVQKLWKKVVADNASR
jgi:hypothetical protein